VERRPAWSPSRHFRRDRIRLRTQRASASPRCRAVSFAKLR
jgi:hypothetical protein